VKRVCLLALLLAGCGGSASSTSTVATHSATVSSRVTSATLPRTLHLSSAAFAPGTAIPRRYTCDGANVSLPLQWSRPPAATRALLLVMRDPDAPTPNFVHWALADIAPSTRGVASGGVPMGAIEGRNSFGTIGYRGPCPPAGQTHHYVITLLALAGRAAVRPGFSPDQAVRSLELATGRLVGTFRR
jgi:Raf kinase inhibitor-like YbhB/YbcL family protein